jgi:hypothetical protein
MTLTSEEWERLEELARKLEGYAAMFRSGKSPKDKSAADYHAADAEATRSALAEIRELRKLKVHCPDCGADYAATGVEAGCPCKLRARNEKLEQMAEAALQWWNATTEDEIGEGAEAIGGALEALREAGHDS